MTYKEYESEVMLKAKKFYRKVEKTPSVKAEIEIAYRNNVDTDYLCKIVVEEYLNSKKG